MGKRRTIACCLLLVALLVVGGACSSGNKSASQAKTAQAKAKAAKAKRARVLALQRRRAAARRLAAQRRAAALRRLQSQLPPPTVPVTVPVTVPTTVAPATPASDLLAIQRTFAGLNAAFARGVAAGIVTSNAANYWVAAGVYTAAQCTKFEADRGGGVVSEAFVVNPDTLQPLTGWVDPTVGKAPTGRIYSFSVDNVETLVPTGEKRTQTAVMHASVNTLGVAHLFFRCA